MNQYSRSAWIDGQNCGSLLFFQAADDVSAIAWAHAETKRTGWQLSHVRRIDGEKRVTIFEQVKIQK